MNKNKLLSLIITLGGCIALASSCFWGFSSDSSPNESIMESSSEETYSYENESSSIEESFSSEKNEHVHDFIPYVTPATCTKAGITIYRCECGAEYDTIINVLPHTYTNGVCSCGNIENIEALLEYTLSEDETYYILSGHRIPDVSPIYTTYSLVIPSTYNGLPVQEIAAYALDDCNSINAIVIPDSVITIGRMAFAYCQLLREVTIGKGVECIGEDAFELGQRIENFTVSEENTAYKAIDGSLYTKDGKTLIKYKAGSENTVFEIPEWVTTISDYALSHCWNLESISFPSSLTTIPYYTVSSCPNLKFISISANTTQIEARAFVNCPSLMEIFVASENPAYQSIDGSLYTKDGTILLQYTVGKEKNTFVIPDGVVTIEQGACSYSKTLTTVVIPNSVTTIAPSAFIHSINLNDIYISKNITSIDTSSFYNTGYYNNESNWENEVLYLDRYLLDAKQSIAGAYTVKEGTHMLADDAFNSCKELTEITINAPIIGENAFLGCDKLQKVVLGDEVTTVRAGAFFSNDNLLSVTIGKNVIAIEDNAFSCYKLVEIYNKSSIAITKNSRDHGQIGYYAKDIYTDVYVSKLSVDENGYALYIDGDNVCLLAYLGEETDLIVPESVTEINANAFRNDGMEHLTSITFNNKLERIGAEAFYNCHNLTQVILPDSLTSIAIAEGFFTNAR